MEEIKPKQNLSNKEKMCKQSLGECIKSTKKKAIVLLHNKEKHMTDGLEIRSPLN